MNIALINTNQIRPPISPVGLEYIAEALHAAGHEVHVLDLCWEADIASAVAAFYFGRNRPWPTTLVCLLYGLLDAGQIRLQTFGLPPNLIQTIPYLMVVVALCISGLRMTRRERSIP